MTQLLISVTNVDEARIAMENGADFIDLKDPSDGALGALDIHEVSKITTYVNHTKLVSATIGNITFNRSVDTDIALARIRALVLANVDIIKIGFFDSQVINNRQKNIKECELSTKLLKAMQSMCLSKTVKFIAVLFAENTYHKHFINGLLENGFEGLMIDTMVKNGQSAIHFNHDEQFKEIADCAQAKGCWFGVAGSLQPQDITLLKYLNPTYIGFRGAACEGNERKKEISSLRVQALRKLM